MIKIWNKHPPRAWQVLLVSSGKLFDIFFCQIVADVIDTREIMVAITPSKGIFFPMSKPKTSTAPKNPSNIPIH